MTCKSKTAYSARMTKAEAIHLFDGVPALASALGISRQAIYMWPDDLPQRTADEVRGAALRLGRLPGRGDVGEQNGEAA